MEESTLDALGASLAGNNEGVSNGILVQVHELIDPCSEATEVDIASTIGFGQVGSRISIAKIGTVYWFPATYNSNYSSVRSQLQQYLIRSCQAAGFTWVVNSQEILGKGISKGLRMSMMCARRRVTSSVSKHFSNFDSEFRIRILKFEFRIRILHLYLESL
jgi:hypothetical protein